MFLGSIFLLNIRLFMTEYKTIKVPMKIWEVYDKYIKKYDSVYNDATGMIHDLIRDKARTLLEEMTLSLDKEKNKYEIILTRLDELEKKQTKQ